MNIANFNRFRAGSGDMFFDIENIGKHHENEGVMATAHLMKSYEMHRTHTVEIRKKDSEVAMFAYIYSDIELPEFWRDAEVLFRWQDETKRS